MRLFLNILLILLLVSCGGTKGEKGNSGNDGTTGASGKDGEKGIPGRDGNNGNPGPQGTSAPTVSTIQFCPGSTTVYPNVFPEFGIVINNEIYAVFTSNGNNFLAKIVPGNYISTATGLQCNFTVLPGGVLQ